MILNFRSKQPRMDQEFDIKICWLKIDGITCISCVNIIKKELAKIDGFINIEIYIEDGKAFLEYDNKSTTKEMIIDRINELGFDCTFLIADSDIQNDQNTENFSFFVDNITCQSCVDNIENNLKKRDGVNQADVDLITKKVSVSFQYPLVRKEDILDLIETLGFDYRLESASKNEQDQENFQFTIPKTNITESEGSFKKCLIKVSGMTCSSCVANIERNISKIPGIQGILVALLSQKAEVLYDPCHIKSDEIVRKINDLGYKALLMTNNIDSNFSELVLCIPNISVASVVEIETLLKKSVGVKSVEINPKHLFKCTVQYDSDQIGARDIVALVKSFGFVCYPHYGSNSTSESYLLHRKEIQLWRNSFLLSLFFCIPSMLLMIYHMSTMDNSKNDCCVIAGWSHYNLMQFILATPVQFYGARHFYRQAFKAIQYRQPNMDLLIMLATTVAYVYSLLISFYFWSIGADHSPKTFFETPPMLLTFISLGRWLEHIAKGRTSEALTKLMSLKATEATLVQLDENKNIISENSTPIELVHRGDMIKVLPGSKIPIDGRVVFGKSNVDESLITGESQPVPKNSGCYVIGGSINQNGTLILCATHIGKNSTLSVIVDLVEKAQTSKAPIQQLADKIAGFFVPVVIFLSFLTLITWIMIGRKYLPIIEKYNVHKYSDMSQTEMIYQFAFQCSITVLLIACPCSLGLATPTAVMVGTGVGALNGILIKGAVALENFCKTNCIVFDKTGTITYGCPQVDQIHLFGRFQHSDEWIEMFRRIVWSMMSAESSSEHPIGKSIFNFCEKLFPKPSSKLLKCIDFRSETGFGISCQIENPFNNDSMVQFENVSGTEEIESGNFRFQINGFQIYCIKSSNTDFDFSSERINILIGTKEWMTVNNVPVPEMVQTQIERLEQQGMTIALCSINQKIVCLISMIDQVKPDARLTVFALKKQNLKVILMTGDNRQAANSIAKQVGIDKCFAQVLPSDKAKVIKDLQNRGMIVAMVGDGINDSPALAQANIGIAFSTGTDVAVEAADIILIKNHLMDIVHAKELSQLTVSRIRLNILFASIYNLIGIPMAAGLLIPFGIVLKPWMGSAAMALSSITVVCSSLMLKHWKKSNNLKLKSGDENGGGHFNYNEFDENDECSANFNIEKQQREKSYHRSDHVSNDTNINLSKILSLMPNYSKLSLDSYKPLLDDENEMICLA